MPVPVVDPGQARIGLCSLRRIQRPMHCDGPATLRIPYEKLARKLILQRGSALQSAENPLSRPVSPSRADQAVRTRRFREPGSGPQASHRGIDRGAVSCQCIRRLHSVPCNRPPTPGLRDRLVAVPGGVTS